MPSGRNTARRGRSGDPKYGLKDLLVRNLEQLRPDQLAKIINTLGGDPEGQQILLAWIAKEKLRDLVRLPPAIAGTTPTSDRIRHHLDGTIGASGWLEMATADLFDERFYGHLSNSHCPEDALMATKVDLYQERRPDWFSLSLFGQ